MPDGQPLPPAGCYPDPYQSGQIRWFDGSVWTSHAVDEDEIDPDRRVEAGWSDVRPEDRRWRRPFATRDLVVPRGSDDPAGPSVPTGQNGGWNFRIFARRGVVGSMGGPVNAARWLAAATVILLLLAWGDRERRWFLLGAGAACLVATVVVHVRASRERERWRQLGRQR